MNCILWWWFFLYELYTMMLDFSIWIVYYDVGFFFMNCILWCWIFLYEFILWCWIFLYELYTMIFHYELYTMMLDIFYELYTMMMVFSLWIVYYDVGFFYMNCILWCWNFLYELYTMMLDFSLWILYYDAQIHEHQVCGIKFDWTGWGRRLFKCWTSERSRTKEVGRSVGRSGTFHSKSFH